MLNLFPKKFFIFICLIFFILHLFAQVKFITPTPLVLGEKINNVNEEFSGMSLSGERLFLLPQYGDALINGDDAERDTVLMKKFSIYSYPVNKITYTIDHHAALDDPEKFEIKNLSLLPDSIKKNFEGFEAITVVKNTVFLSIETHDENDYCYLLEGSLNLNRKELNIDPLKIISLRRYPYINNAGFESLTYLPKEKKLLAIYEFNTMPNGGIGYLIDTTFKLKPKPVNIPKLFFRITDISATKNDALYGINYYWNGDYDSYLNNCLIRSPEKLLPGIIPLLKDSINSSSKYLNNKTTCFARIIKMDNRKSAAWKNVVAFENTCTGNNWEGLALFRKGALIISDANRNSKQVTTLAYIEFPHK